MTLPAPTANVAGEMPRIPHPIPYQGSKRTLAPTILAHLPPGTDTLFEPFCGSAAISIAAAREGRAARIHINDSLAPLARLWQGIIETPDVIANEYAGIWTGQQDNPRAFYDAIREEFNKDHSPAKLLFLLARCVKSAVRFNAAGQFNQSPDRRRLGTHPARMRKSILGASSLLRGRTTVTSGDYAKILAQAGPQDVVYMDPPYQGTSRARDQRYHQPLDRGRFIGELERTLARGVRVIISFDGKCGNRTYGEELPRSLGLIRLHVHAGRSSQATLNGKTEETIESLYVSRTLISQSVDHTVAMVTRPAQPPL